MTRNEFMEVCPPDKYGLFWAGDPGDATQRTGCVQYITQHTGECTSKDRELFRKALETVFSRECLFIRHPDAKYPRFHWGWTKIWCTVKGWFGVEPNEQQKEEVPEVVSRDNLVTLILAMDSRYHGHIVMKMLGYALGYHIKRLGFCPNVTDFLHPQHWGMFIRSLGWWVFYPVLLCTDFFLVIACAAATYQDKNETSSKLNLTLLVHQAGERLKTPWNPLMKWILKKIDLQYAWDWYFQTSPIAQGIEGTEPQGKKIRLNKLVSPLLEELRK